MDELDRAIAGAEPPLERAAEAIDDLALAVAARRRDDIAAEPRERGDGRAARRAIAEWGPVPARRSPSSVPASTVSPNASTAVALVAVVSTAVPVAASRSAARGSRAVPAARRVPSSDQAKRS